MLSVYLLIVIVFSISEYTIADIPEGLYGDKELQQGSAVPQVDPMGSTFWVQVGAPETDASGECTQLISLAGHRVSDQIPLPCTTFPIVSADKRMAIVGEALYATSEAPDTLIQVTGQACDKFTYEHNQDTLNIDQSPVSDKECREVRGKMKQLLIEQVQKAAGSNTELLGQARQKLDQIYADLNPPKPAPDTQTATNNNNSPSTAPQKKAYEAFVSNPTDFGGNLVRNIAVSGPGIVSDVIRVDASEPTDIIKSESRLIVGRVLFSNEPGNLIHITGDKCVQRTHAKDGELQMKDLGDAECQAVRKQIREARGEKGAAQPIAQNYGPTSGLQGGAGQAVAQNSGPTNLPSGAGQVAGQVVRPVDESIRLIVSSLSQIVNMILSFLAKNVRSVVDSPLAARRNIASGISGLAGSLEKNQNGNRQRIGNMNGIQTNYLGSQVGGVTGPASTSFLLPQTFRGVAANGNFNVPRGDNSPKMSEEKGNGKQNQQIKKEGFNPFSGLTRIMGINS